MSLCRRITCDTCHKSKEVSYSANDLQLPTTCSDCKAAKADEARQTELDALAALPVEERLRKIEEFIYDHKKLFHPGRTPLF